MDRQKIQNQPGKRPFNKKEGSYKKVHSPLFPRYDEPPPPATLEQARARIRVHEDEIRRIKEKVADLKNQLSMVQSEHHELEKLVNNTNKRVEQEAARFRRRLTKQEGNDRRTRYKLDTTADNLSATKEELNHMVRQIEETKVSVKEIQQKLGLERWGQGERLHLEEGYESEERPKERENGGQQSPREQDQGFN